MKTKAKKKTPPANTNGNGVPKVRRGKNLFADYDGKRSDAFELASDHREKLRKGSAITDDRLLACYETLDDGSAGKQCCSLRPDVGTR